MSQIFAGQKLTYHVHVHTSAQLNSQRRLYYKPWIKKKKDNGFQYEMPCVNLFIPDLHVSSKLCNKIKDYVSYKNVNFIFTRNFL